MTANEAIDSLIKDMHTLQYEIASFRAELSRYQTAKAEGRLIELPSVPKADLDLIAANLKEVFDDWAVVDRSAGLNGMTYGEAAIANAILNALHPYDRAAAEAALASQEGAIK